MTNNQIQLKQAETAEERAKEEKRINDIKAREEERSNRAKENLEKRGQDKNLEGAYAKAFGGLLRKGTAATKVGNVLSNINDPSWYNKDPQLVKDVASLAFGAPLGSTSENRTTIKEVTGTGAAEQVLVHENRVPGVMGLTYTTTIPNTQLMKTIGDKYYAFIRHANSGSRNYEANDLMMYLLAATECYGQLTNAARMYSILNTYKRENWYYAKGFLKAMGCQDYFINSLMDIATFRAKLNVLIRRVNSFYIPNTFPLFLRKVWLNSTIIKDNNIKRSSEYMFVPDHILIYNEDSSHLYLNAQELKYRQAGNYSMYDYLQQLENMVDAMYKSEDLGIMSGDIYKAYKDSGLFTLSEISEDFHIESQHIPEVLSQINSATVVGRCNLTYAGIFTFTDASGFSGIKQGNPQDNSTNNGLRLNFTSGYQIPFIQYNANLKTLRIIKPYVDQDGDQDYAAFLEHDTNVVNMYKDDVSPDDVMVATRLQCNTLVSKKTTGSDSDVTVSIQNTGDAIINTIIPVIFQKNSNNVFVLFNGKEFYDGIINNDYHGVPGYGFEDPNIRLVNACKLIPAFDWAPRIRIISHNFHVGYYDDVDEDQDPIKVDVNIDPMVIFDNFDFANYMLISKDTLAKIHSVALMSLFDV